MVQSWSPTTDLPSNKQLMSKDFCWLNQGDLKTQLPRVHLCSPLWPERTSWHEPELTASLRAKKTRTESLLSQILYSCKSLLQTWKHECSREAVAPPSSRRSSAQQQRLQFGPTSEVFFILAFVATLVPFPWIRIRKKRWDDGGRRSALFRSTWSAEATVRQTEGNPKM